MPSLKIKANISLVKRLEFIAASWFSVYLNCLEPLKDYSNCIVGNDFFNLPFWLNLIFQHKINEKFYNVGAKSAWATVSFVSLPSERFRIIWVTRQKFIRGRNSIHLNGLDNAWCMQRSQKQPDVSNHTDTLTQRRPIERLSSNPNDNQTRITLPDQLEKCLSSSFAFYLELSIMQ